MAQERSAGRDRGSRRGFTLVELAVAVGVFVIGVLGFARTLASLEKARERARATALALEAARQTIERIDAEAFSGAFRQFNGDSTDDPGGAGTGPGAGFAVPGLTPRRDDADGLPGEIEFPIALGAPSALRENITDVGLGMPRDLSGDGIIDAADHATAYTVLPVRVRVRWLDASGEAAIELRTMLGSY